jgi:hypothetical protein
MTFDPTSPELSPIKRALVEIRDLRSRLAELEETQSQAIAIIGMGLRFPGDVNDAESFWRLLHGSVDAITEIPPERWSLDAFYDPDASIPGKMTTRYGSFLKNIDLFDAAGSAPPESPSASEPFVAWPAADLASRHSEP